MKGFSLLELLITLVIIGILAVVAIPAYNNYTRRAYYSEVVMAAQPFKLGVTECYTRQNSIDNCNGGSHGVPANRNKANGAVQSVTVAKGAITVTPTDKNGITSKDTYILTPSIIDNKLSWKASGGGVSNGYAG